MKRRNFLKNTAVISSATILKPQTVFGSKANSAIRIGVIGLGNRGSQLTGYFLENPDVEAVDEPMPHLPKLRAWLSFVVGLLLLIASS